MHQTISKTRDSDAPVVFSLTPSLLQVVVALVGMWYFKEASSTANAISIWLGLAAGFLFVFAKQVSVNVDCVPKQNETGTDGVHT